MIVLGIDPGLAHTGWAVIEKIKSPHGENLKLENCGCIKTDTSTDLPQRLLQIFSELNEIIEKYKPDVLCIEKQYLYQNSQTVLSISQARGVILLAAAKNTLRVNEYNPKEVKIAITGYGSADKQQVRNMVKYLLKVKSIPKPDDITDAVAVGLCHINTVRI